MDTRTPNILSRIFANPLAVRELRVACKSWKLVLVLTAYLLIQGAIFAIWVYVASDNNGIYIDPTSIGSGLFTTLSVVLVVIVMMVFPAFSSTAIASEHEKKSFDLLLLTPLMPWEIALGKFFAAAIQASIFLIATVPLFAMANMFGGIEPEVFFMVLWVLVLLSILISFVGVYASSLVKKAIPAVLVTYMFAGLLGMVLLTIFLVLQVASTFAAAAFPLVSFLISPNLMEGAYYVGTLTVTCILYCSFLFISTTNRLKPTSHNKSTALRIFWTVCALVVPAQLATYFMMSRLPSQDYAWNTMTMGAIYIGLLLMVPVFSAPAEAPIASRRVRREMEKLPAAMRNPVAGIFFPGSARGVAHTAMVCVLAMASMVAAAWVCEAKLVSRLDDQTQLVTDFAEVAEPTAAPRGPGTTPPGTMVTITSPSIAGTTPADMRAMLTDYFGHQRNAMLYLAITFLVTLLVLAQITWRLSLSGISRGLCGLVAGLILVTWLVLPYIAALIADSRSADSLITHFSPIQAVVDSLRMGDLLARSTLEDAAGADRYIELAGRLRGHWIMFVSVAAAVGTILLVFNVVSYRKVKATFARMAQAPAAGQVPAAGDPTPVLPPSIMGSGAAVAPLSEPAAQPANEQPPPQA